MFSFKKPINAKRNCEAFMPILIFGFLLNAFCPLNSQRYEPSLSTDEIISENASAEEYALREKRLRFDLKIGKGRNDTNYVYHVYLQLSELYVALGNPVKAEALLDSALLFGPPCSKIEIDKIHYYIEKIRGNHEKAYYYLEQAYGNLGDTSSLKSVEQLATLDTRQIAHVLQSKPEDPPNLMDLQGTRQVLFFGLIALMLALATVSFMAWLLQRRANRALKLKYQLIEQDRYSTQHEVQSQEQAKDQGDLTKSEAVEWLAILESATLAHIADNSFTLDGLSDTLGLSRRQVQRRLKAATGLTATAYLHETRLQQARLLLESGQVTSVKNLAAAIGMRDVKYFSQEFKKRFGKSPSKFTGPVE